MAVQTGNGSSIAFTSDTNFNTALLVTGIDMGEQTRETLPYVPLAPPSPGTSLELHHPGDFATARQVTVEGLFDISDVTTNGPDFETRVVQSMTITLPTPGVTYKDDGTFVTYTGPNLANNELMIVTVVFQTNNQGASRGWTPAT